MFKKDYILEGKHATYAKNLIESSEKLQRRRKGVAVIRFGIDLIQMAPLIGAAYGEKKLRDKTSSDRFTVQANAVIKQQENLEVIYRLILLTDKSGHHTNEQLIDRAFKDDEDEERTKKNMEIFDSYVRGGIELLQEEFTANSTNEDDYVNDIKDICRKFNLDFELEKT
ncbi:MAG: hypothetical protein ACLKAO_12005 [Alkaliphilus sp.]